MQKTTVDHGKLRKTKGRVNRNNDDLLDKYMHDTRKDGRVPDVYIARVIKKFGGGRVNLFYIGADQKPQVKQAFIRNLLRKSGVEEDTVVMVADTHLSGNMQYEIMAVIPRDKLREINKDLKLDNRILDFKNCDAEKLMIKPVYDEGFTFDIASESESDEQENQTQKYSQRVDKIRIDDI